MKKKIIIFCLILTVIIGIFIVTTAPKDSNASKKHVKITKLEQLKGKKIGILTGSLFEDVVKNDIKGSIPEYYNNYTDEIEAAKSGKIVGFILDEPTGRVMLNIHKGFRFYNYSFSSEGYAFILPKDNVELKNKINGVIKKMKDSGELEELDKIWFSTDESKKIIEEIPKTGKNGTLRYATNSTVVPFDYYKDNQMVGYEIAIMAKVTKELGYGLEIIDMDFPAIIPSIVTKKSDISGACITISTERAKSVAFTEPIYTGGMRLFLYDGESGLKKAEENFINSVRKSFIRTFIDENRYMIILKGIGVTILISFFSVLFGTLLAFFVCTLRRSKTDILSTLAKIYIQLIQGTPSLVLLLIMYYIVFGKSSINPIIVAIIAFSIDFAAYASETFRTSIDAIDNGQIEASKALGLNKLQTFIKIIFPQAAIHALPVYKGQIISTVKMTSIVGYIAIQDLTKIGDIIRSRTYETFFPILTIAAIYFLISYLMTKFLSDLEIKINPKYRKRGQNLEIEVESQTGEVQL